MTMPSAWNRHFVSCLSDAHAVERHRHVVGGILGLARGTDRAVQFIVLIAVAAHAAQLRPVLHDGTSGCSECHLLQPLPLTVVGIGRLRAVAKLCIDGVPLLVVAYHIHNNALLTHFITRERRILSGGEESKTCPTDFSLILTLNN